VQQVGNGPRWGIWADAWLSGADRSWVSTSKAGERDEGPNHFLEMLTTDAAHYAANVINGETRWSERALNWVVTWVAEGAKAQLPTIDLAALVAQAIKEEPS